MIRRTWQRELDATATPEQLRRDNIVTAEFQIRILENAIVRTLDPVLETEYRRKLDEVRARLAKLNNA